MIERRSAKRFQVDWQVRVEGSVNGAERFNATGLLRNISSSGALVLLPERLLEGTAVDVYIKLPLRSKKWMKYPAHVVRVEQGDSVGAAIRFDVSRPDFRPPLGLAS